jgi:hypothetical protein
MKKYWVVAAVLALAGCGGGSREETAAAPESAAPAASAPPIDTANAGTLTGKVAFTGTKPTMRSIDMGAVPACQRQHASEPARYEEVVVNDNNTLRNVFVWVKSGLPDRQWPTPAEPVKLDQHSCMYKPHVIGVMANQPIDILNSDPTNHNIHPTPKVNREWNESQPPKGEKKTKSFPRQEVMIPVKCNVHPWMKAYIGVVSHPYFAVTGEDGTFSIKDLPPGSYTVEAWHEKFGAQETQVTVAPKETKTADFTFKG